MKTPAPAPEAPARGIVQHKFVPSKGDRLDYSQAEAFRMAYARAATRGRQQVYRRRLSSGKLGSYWTIQDVR